MQTLDSIDDLASLIRFHRKQAELTQVKLAIMAGVSRKVVQELEAAREGVSWRNLLAILHVLNLKLQPVGPLVEHWTNTMATIESREVGTPAPPS